MSVLDLSERLAASLAVHTIPAPAPGVYEHVPFHVYHAWDAISNSRLSRLKRSPAHLQAYLAQPWEDTPAQQIGRAAHCAVLEPARFDHEFCRSTVTDRRTKAGKDEWNAQLAEYGEGNVFKADDYDAIVAMRESLYRHKAASGLLKGPGQTELSIVWVDEETGLVCKARLDKHLPTVARGTVIDLKSTLDASKRAFEKSIWEWGYHRQGAFYLSGARAVGLPAMKFMPIAVEKEAPFAVGAYHLLDGELGIGAIEAGANEVAQLLRVYQRCKQRNEWPAYSEHVEDVSLPDWAFTRSDDDVRTVGTDYLSVL